MRPRELVFWRGSNLACGLALAALGLLALLAPWISPDDPNRIDVGLRFAAPGAGQWLGRDALGRDLLSRIIGGARVSLPVGLIAALGLTAVGTLLGAWAAYAGGLVDALIMRTADVLMSIPTLFLVLTLIVVLGPGLEDVVLVIVATGWTGMARLVRAEVLSLKEREFVLAARASGAHPARVLFRHVLPNALAPVYVALTFGVADAILMESGLSFLGLGVQPPTASWGSLLSDGRDSVGEAWWLVVFPGLAIFAVLLLVNHLGEAARRHFDPEGDTVSLLVVEDLSISFGAGPRVVDRVSFRLEAGASLGVLGASGSGKSLTAMAVMGLLPASASVRSGRILFEGRDLLSMDKETRRTLRGGAMGLVFQEPFTALNPLMRVGSQIEESLRLHLGLDASAATQGAVEALERVGLNPGPERARQYPHQYSGGMRQRALLAMALAAKPRLLIADEPTTALDSTVQAQIVALLKRLQVELGFALLIISHDLAVIHALAGRAVVMEQGRVVEEADLARILASPASPAARRLIAAYRGLSMGENGVSSYASQSS